MFWVWRRTTADEEKHGFVRQSKVTGPDVHVSWGPYYSGGMLLFRNEGTEEAKNVRLQCSTESGWRPILSPEVVASIPPGGHFRAIDVTKYGETEDESGFATVTGQSIAEFVHSLPVHPLTMTVVFEDQLGEERARDVQVSAASWIGYTRVRVRMEGPTAKPEVVESVSLESKAEQAPTQPRPPAARGSANAAGVDFTLEVGRNHAVAAYSKQGTCSEAALARAAGVDPADLSKWKKGLLPAGSDKSSRIEKALKDNKAPIPAAKQPKDF
jgi:hypothetical protein